MKFFSKIYENRKTLISITIVYNLAYAILKLFLIQ